MIKHKVEDKITDFPVELHEFLQAGRIYDSSCSPDARTWYCDGGFYIKQAAKGALVREAQMGRLFWKLGLGVEILRYLSGDRDYLVTRSAPGDDLTHWTRDPQLLCRVLADALGKLHGRSTEGIPVSAKLQEYGDTANRTWRDGHIGEHLRMDYFGINSPEEAWQIIQRHREDLKTDTLIHGDACLPNLICKDGTFSAFVDCGLAGAGDRHIDLFWTVWSLQFNLRTDAYTDLFLDLYGRNNFDREMLRTVAALELLGS